MQLIVASQSETRRHLSTCNAWELKQLGSRATTAPPDRNYNGCGLGEEVRANFRFTLRS